MSRYLLSVYQPEGVLPADDLEKVMKDVGEVNRAMQQAGAWVFGAGLHHPSTATVVRVDGGEVLMTDGPFVEGKEFLGGFTILEVPDLDAALEWGRRLAAATTLPIEVRPFQSEDERGCA